MTKKLRELFDLSGKVAVVTGGSGYLGEAIGESLAELRADLVIVGTNLKKSRILAKRLSKDYDIKAWAGYMDISKPLSIKKSFTEIKKRFSHIDILINNAYFGASGRLEEISEDSWKMGIDGTINGVFRCTQAVLPYFNSGGVIINIASMYGLVSPDLRIYNGDKSLENPANYGAGKAAIIQFTRYSACNLASRGIRINCISPGAFPHTRIKSNQHFISRLENKIPLARVGLSHELKGAIAFLASDASSYVTGFNLVVDGGLTAW